MIKMDSDKLQKLSYILRVIVMIALMLVLAFLCIVQLMKIQIVDGAMYAGQSQKNYTAYQSVQAARGQIFDSEGRVLNTNKIVYKVIVQRAFFTQGRENEIIAAAIDILKKHGETWVDSVPISTTEPFVFTAASDSELDSFKSRIEVNVDASVENCLSALMKNYGISEEYDPVTARAIAGVRYEMEIRDFSFNNRYTMCEDISIETVIELKERAGSLPGIDIIEEPMRVYLDSSIAPHIRGTIGAISAEEYTERKDDGYSLNDRVGKNGIEQAMESILRGENGTRTIVRNQQGEAVADSTTTNVVTGNSVMLTIDSEFQSTVQDILENHISWLRTIEETAPEAWWRGQNTEGGAVAVIEVKTGKVLALANYPSYDLNDYISDYSAVLGAEGTPLFDRSISGRYRPGSTFKSVTAIAGLLSGKITDTSLINCTGVYEAFTDYKPRCTGTHLNINVVSALKTSCNIFFYEVGMRIGIDYLADTAAGFGIGTNLGLEIGGDSGRMTTPTLYELLKGETYNDGDTVQTSIGQSETLVTPLHLAVQAMTLANDGVRYQPYLVDSVWDYEGETLLYKTEPKIAAEVGADSPELYETVRQGMMMVTENVVWPPDNMKLSHFDYLPSVAAIKTGTPEVIANKEYNSTILGYYPADDPVIAFGIVLENSEYSRYMVRNIIDAYFYDAYEADINEEGLVASPWKRWSPEKVMRLTGSVIGDNS